MAGKFDQGETYEVAAWLESGERESTPGSTSPSGESTLVIRDEINDEFTIREPLGPDDIELDDFPEEIEAGTSETAEAPLNLTSFRNTSGMDSSFTARVVYSNSEGVLNEENATAHIPSGQTAAGLAATSFTPAGRGTDITVSIPSLSIEYTTTIV